MPEKRFDEYPNSLSGGMRQRIMIAMAIACKPKLLIADEPTTALDVTIQAQILDLLKRLRDESGTSIILITHDLGVIHEMCDRAAIMYCGQIVEQGTTEDLFKNPCHPYTKGLLCAVPSVVSKQEMLCNIPGTVPPISEYSKGCRFDSRCKECRGSCKVTVPQMVWISNTHAVRCSLVKEVV